MKKIKYYNDNKRVVLNFTEVYCKNETEVLNSECFKDVFGRFCDSLVKHQRVDLLYLLNLVNDPKNSFIDLFKLLNVVPYSEINNLTDSYHEVLKNRDLLYQLVEDFYNYWRKLERYSLIVAKLEEKGLQGNVFIDANKNFTDVILKTYRTISEKILNKHFPIYRQLPAGINASLLISDLKWAPQGSIYEIFNDIPGIESVMIRPPFISYSRINKRTGIYPEVFENPLIGVKLDPNEYLCYPIYVGSALAFVYFHRDFMAHGIALSNLFEFAPWDEIQGKKPNLIYLFGYGTESSSFYYDESWDIYVGRAPLDKSVDYFGYMKKMLLTLYNVKMIKEEGLPIHGACVNIVLKNGMNKTLVIIGDSGAGKSETLAALTACAGDDIVQMHTIFDDMGTFKIKDNEIYAYGTEIGAFVRTDDMASDYAYKEMDRAIFLNPDKQNARLVIPVATYKQISKGFKVDMLFYANNYDNSDEIRFFKTRDEALETFIRGARMAKGTTGEVGLVESFFANPFGPCQKQEETRALLNKMFDNLFERNIPVGEIHTRLAIHGYEQKGPEAMAKKLFELLYK